MFRVPLNQPPNDSLQSVERERSSDKRRQIAVMQIRNNNNAEKVTKGGEITGGGQTNGLVLSRAGTVEDEEDRDSDSNCFGIARIAAN